MICPIHLSIPKQIQGVPQISRILKIDKFSLLWEVDNLLLRHSLQSKKYVFSQVFHAHNII